MSLDRRDGCGCKQLNWLAEGYNHGAVILVFKSQHIGMLIQYNQ